MKLSTKKKKQSLRAHRKGRLLPKDEDFCRAIVAGVSGTQAYRNHIALGTVTTGTAQQGAYIILQRPEIALRIEELREKDKRTIEEKLGFGREQVIQQLVAVATTPVGEVDEHSPLAQEVEYTEGEGWTKKKVKMMGKQAALDALAKMAGWFPSSGNGGQGPQVTINLGAIFSPPDGSNLKAIRVSDVPLLDV